MTKLVNCKHIAQIDLQRNVETVYSIVGNSTLQWYANASETLYDDCLAFGVDYRTMCAVVAVLSPALRWDKNLLTARQVIADFQGDGVMGGYMAYAANVHKAIRILSGESPDNVLGGLKVIAFYHNLLQPNVNTGYVTIDRHAINIALHGINASLRKSGDFTATKKAHEQIAAAYVHVAQSFGVLPQQLQAATWSYCADSNSF